MQSTAMQATVNTARPARAATRRRSLALASTLHTRKKLPATWIIHVPGGTLKVEIDGHSNAVLTGPAVLVREHEVAL